MSSPLPPPCEAPRDVAPCPHPRGTLTATVLGSCLTFVVGAIVNVALPAMRAGLATDAAGAQWIVNAYLLPVGALVLLGGALGDHLGRRRVFLTGLAVFAAGSLACALAPSLAWFLAARTTQGVGAALLAPSSLAILAASFTGPARGRAVGTWAAAGAIGGAVAPVLGGWVVDAFGWRFTFALVVPAALAAIAVGRRSIVESRGGARAAARLDWPGAGLATGALLALTWALIAAPQRGASDRAVLLALGAGLALAALFLALEHRLRAAAMLPLALFRQPTFAGVSLLTLFLYAALGGLLVLLPYALIEVHGYSATAAGAAILPFPLLMGLLSRWSGGLIETLGARRMLTFGPLCVASGFALFARLPASDPAYARDVLPALVLVAVGMAASVAPLTTTVMSSVPDERVGVASGVNNAIARCAGLIATALLGSVMAASSAGFERFAGGFHRAAAAGAVLSLLASAAAATLVAPPTPD